MSSQTATSPTSQSRTTTIQTRQTHCTHSTFTREFSSCDKLATCQMCKGGPDLGWVYVCTEDKERLHASYAYAQQQLSSSSTTVSSSSEAGDVVQLNAWIEKAIVEGHYTSEQVELVKAQRAAVLETIRTDYHMRRGSTPEVQSYLSPEEPEGTEPVPEKAYVKVSSSALLKACHSGLGNVTIPMCCLRVCSGCMPSATERGWQSLDRVCKYDYMTNDRLSEILADVVANIDSACMTIEDRKVPTQDTSPDFDTVGMRTGRDLHQARSSDIISPNYVSGDDNDNGENDGSEICYGDLAEAEIPAVDIKLTKRKSLMELFHWHRNHAKGSVTGTKKDHGQQGLGSTSMDDEMVVVSENTRPTQSRTARC
ncbi:hypothetical protein AJ78_06880 [Emergomyces pasteurianus Ep9510]|uniref:Uncharacterized protein n=1 Tax=Emergomyces pasteurianus Ep9510 TaxID=1447872 RepID=A0A1J9P7E1_9EURO|nr:hypothetical protein AJ78_06880 [Emergomyces pasteurianus Ep9510]